MKTKQKIVRPLTKRVLQAIADGLEEIEAHFQLEGFGNGEEEPSEDLSSAESDLEDDSEEHEEYERYSGISSFDREEIEVAIDEFISNLISERVFRKGRAKEPPSFSVVFERFFGEHHDLAKKARKFEEYIKGYFGAIDYDDMRHAYDEFQEIREFVREKAGGESDIAES